LKCVEQRMVLTLILTRVGVGIKEIPVSCYWTVNQFFCVTNIFPYTNFYFFHTFSDIQYNQESGIVY
jgi:hypothetical protein